MHPPVFLPTHLLSDWLDCCLEIRCSCQRMVMASTRLMQAKHGNHPVRAFVKRLRRKVCHAGPAQAWLAAGMHRTCHGGPDVLNWSVGIKLW